MRAVLILLVLMAWALCILGAVLLTGYLAVTAAGALTRWHLGDNRMPTPPPRRSVAVLATFAVVMIALGALQYVYGSTAAWAVLPFWNALAAALAATVLRRRRNASRRADAARLL